MKKFNFKLEGLLKLRRFKENEIKIEIGKILKKISHLQDYIAELKQNIDQTYKTQEEYFETETSGSAAKFFPEYIEAKKEEIKQKERELSEWQKKYQEKLLEMNMARGEVKVIEKMKEKKFQDHKRKEQKKLDQDLEDIFSMKENGIKREVS